MKQVTLSTVAAFAFCFPVLASANFVYNISFGYPGFVETGTIATTCDDSCALNSSNITAWSFFNADSGAPVAVASTDADAQILGNPVNDLIATAQGIYC
jgi:hypothetical protein